MNKRLTISIVALALLVGLGVGGYYYYQKQERLPDNAILSKNPQLTDEERKVFTDKISEMQSKLEDGNPSDQDRYQYLIELGNSYRGIGELKQARGAYLDATRSMPDNPVAWYELATLEILMEAKQLAQMHIEKAIELNPSNAQYWQSYLVLIDNNPDVTKSLVEEKFNQAIRGTNGNADLIAMYASFLERTNNLPGAVQQWRRAIEADPGRRQQFEDEISRIQEKVR